MNADRKTLVPPILLIIVGIGWLLSNLGIAPQVDWIWTLSLAALGLLALVVCGIDKVSIVLGPFLLAASGFSLLRQMDYLRTDIEIPILVIWGGLLMLVARSQSIPAPKWLDPRAQKDDRQ